jgi:hypothetical protein
MSRKGHFERGWQRNRVMLTLDNAELDILEGRFKDDNSVMSKHIIEQIIKTKMKR